jgi:cyclase
MASIRVIPVLLHRNQGLVKSVRFKNHQYIGDPINTVKIFNEKEVDELCVLDISPSRFESGPNMQLVAEIASEAFMPMAYGGGISNTNQIQAILYEGAEKVVLNTEIQNNPSLLSEAAKIAGSQSIVASIDVKKNLLGKKRVHRTDGKKPLKLSPLEYAKSLEDYGAGEILLTSVDHEGTFSGYDLDLLQLICESVNIPVIACGGAATLSDFKKAITIGKASAVAAGSIFVYNGPHKAVLISYPRVDEINKELFRID